MNNKPILIKGGIHTDTRGRLDFVNEFDMSDVKRVYFTTNAKTNTFRGWQGHKIERRWFFCIKGSFAIDLVKIDHWEHPSENISMKSFVLNEENPQVLCVPGGYANGFVSLEEESKLMIMSDYKIGELSNDEFRFDHNLWRKNK